MPQPPRTYLQPYIYLIPGTGITIDIDTVPDDGDNEITISSTSTAAAGTPAMVFSTSSVAGVASTFLATDSQIAIFDATVAAAIGTAATGSAAFAARRDHVHPTGAGTPSTQASGDAASTGSGPAAAMTDHKHAMPDIYIPVVFGKQGTLAITTESDSPAPFRWYNDSGRTLTFAAVRATATDAPTGATAIIDINVDGTTIMTGTKVVIADGGNTVKQTTFSTTTVADGHYVSMNIDQVGSTKTGQNLLVTVWLKG